MRKYFLIVLLLVACNALADGKPQPIRLALSAVFLGEQQELVVRWKQYLEAHLQRPVVFIQRISCSELIDMLKEGKLDAAWISEAPYVRYHQWQRLLAVGVWQSEPLYQSYLIVPQQDTTTRSIADLRGKIFAYSDPESNSGYFVAQAELFRLGVDPLAFFARTMFTYSHRKSVEAVAIGLVDGARVDGYVYDMLKRLYPEMVAKTRVVQKSRKYGFPPIVARASLPEADYRKLRGVLLSMQHDAEGHLLLQTMGLDKFVAGNDHLFDGVAVLVREVEHAEKSAAKKHQHPQ